MLVKVSVAQSCPTLCDPMDCSPPGFSVHRDSPGKNTGVGCQSFLPRDLPNPGIEPRSPALQMNSLPSEPSGKPDQFFIELYRRWCKSQESEGRGGSRI